ncbi:MAG: hypothetical protein JNK27_11285 [Chitinophagaceae bacterium]|nr:hypothetical protein [Chitinophagaceae bacterium]
MEIYVSYFVNFGVSGYVMKTPILTIIFFFAFSLFARASMDCIWTSSRQGVTIKFLAPCEQRYQMFVDNILTQILNRLNRKDTSSKILVLVNTERLSYPDAVSSNFISISFDTLRQIDDDFISDYYFSKEGQIKKKFSKFSEPLDINSTDSDTSKEVGFKIIYRLDYRLGQTNWADIEKLIKYSEENREAIKKAQKRNNVRYDYNGWYVSLLTIDTFSINKIIGRQNKIKENEVVQKKSTNSYWLWGLLALTAIGAIAYQYRQHSR